MSFTCVWSRRPIAALQPHVEEREFERLRQHPAEHIAAAPQIHLVDHVNLFFAQRI